MKHQTQALGAPRSLIGSPPVARRSAWLYSGSAQIALELALPGPAGRCAGWVILPRAGSAPARQPIVLDALHRAGFATLALDLLGTGVSLDESAAFNPSVLARRLVAATRWLMAQPEARGKRLAYLAAGVGAASAFAAASEPGITGLVSAVVSLNGRVDLAAAQLAAVTAPSLLVVDRRDRLTLEANRSAARRLNGASRLVVAPSFTYLRYALRDPGRLEALLAVEWLSRHVAGRAPDAAASRPSLFALLDSWPAHGRAAAAATVLALLAALSLPSQAALAAGTLVINSGGHLVYTGDAAAYNLVVTDSSSTYIFQNLNGSTITLDATATAAGCAAITSSKVSCPPAASIADMNIAMGTGIDTLTIKPDDSFVPTTVSGGSNGDLLVIDDSGHGFNDPVTLSGTSFQRLLVNPITYSGFASLSVTAETGNNTITVSGTASGVSTTLNAGGGDDAVTVGSSGTLDSIDGPLTVLGGSGTDTLTLSDGSTSTNSLYQSGSAPRAGVAPITFHTGGDIEALVINAGSGADVLSTVNFTGANATLNGGPGNDTLEAVQLGSTPVDFVLTGSPSGQLTGQGTVALTGIDFAILGGGSGNDTLDAHNFSGPVTLFGNGGNDTLLGGSNSDFLDGGTGTDRVVATADSNFVLSNSSLASSLGIDTLSGIDEASLTGGTSANDLDASLFTNGPVTLDGAGGNDTLVGSNQSDCLLGGSGNDIIEGLGGNDTISGGPGDDNIDGNTGTDRIVESGGSFTLTDSSLTGAAGTDTLAGIDEASLTGGSGNDVLDASGFTHGPVTLDGAGGNNTLTGGHGNDCLIGGAGTNELVVSAAGDAGPVALSLSDSFFAGTNRGSDSLTGIQSAALTGSAAFGSVLNAFGFSGPVTLTGGAGGDFLQGGAGNDSIDGGGGNDTLGATASVNGTTMTLSATSLVGGAGVGTDTFANIEFASLVGSSGNDSLDASGFGGTVTLDGLDGNDTLVGNSKGDLLDGGNGTDLASYFVGNNNVTLSGSSVVLPGGISDIYLNIESFLILGGSGPNIFDASAFNFGVAFDGGGGNDLLIGSAFNDTLVGGAGNDTIIGDGGHDSIDGGAGSDVVVDSGDVNFSLSPTLLSGNDIATLSGIEQAVLTGGVSSNVFNVTAFTGTVGLYGAEGDDTFLLGSGGGTVDGGVGGGDQISMTADVPALTLTDATLTGNGSYGVSHIEKANLSGGASNNLIDASGFSGNTTLAGQGGNDTLIAGSGNDVLLGGDGNDSLSAGAGANSLDGGNGTDRWLETGDFNISLTPLGLLGEQDDTVTNIETASLTGGAGDNIINLTGFGGAATIDGGAGNDSLTGGLGSDSLFGNSGDDTLVASPGNDTLNGGDGTDQVYASGNYTFSLTDARLDRTDGSGTTTHQLISIETAHLIGGDQPNLIDASSFGASQPSAGQVTLEGLDGNDTLFAGHGDASLNGGNGADSLVGGPGNDTLLGGDIDTTAGASDSDTLLGNAGNDQLNGGYGNDYLDGGVGNDVLIGASGNDTMLGGPGDDTLSATFDIAPDGSYGNDLLSGGAGNNVIDGGVGQDTLTETGATNYAFMGNSLVSGQGTDVFTGVEAANLTSGDTASLFDLTAFTGTVTAMGGLANDTFFGSQYGDSLDGGQGVNRLVITATASSVNFTLTDAALTGFGASDTLANIIEASLTGSSGPDTLNAAGFSGNATLDSGAGADSVVGGHGDDCLLGGGGNDTLTGGPGANQIFGGAGANVLVESATGLTTSVQFTLTNANLIGLGADVVTNTFDILSNTVAASLTGGSGPDLFDFSAFTGTATVVGDAGNDTFVGGAADGPDSILGGPGIDRLVESGDMNMLLTDTNLSRTPAQGGTPVVDTLDTSIEQASLTGGDSGNTLNAFDFSGPVTLDGGAGDDVLIGGSDTLGLGADSLLGGPGNDTLTGGRGNDTLDGGPGVNLLSETGQDVVGVHFTLSNNFLTRVDVVGTDTDVLLNLQGVSLTGSDGNDTLDASANTRPVTLVGLAGDDRLIGGPAGDSLDGGDGNDILTGNGGGDTIFGGSGAFVDTLVESADSNFKLTNANLIDASFNYLNGIEAASLTGGNGNNTLDASSFTVGPVTLDGGGGNDLLIGTINNDSLRGGAGDDTLEGNGGADILDGQAGTDRLVAAGDENFILSNTALTVSVGAQNFINTVASIESASLTGGLGNNTLDASAFGGPVTLSGGEGNDVLIGGPRDDCLLGGNGDDTLTGGLGHNLLDGGPGNDLVAETTNGNVSLTPGLLTYNGIDTLDNIERVSLMAGNGGALLDASTFAGPVTLIGGAGNDTLLGGSGDDYLKGGLGNDSISGGAGNNTLIGDAGNDTLLGGPGNDSLDGGAGNDLLNSGAGNNTLLGGPGNDTLIAGAGHDSLDGGADNDVLTGGGGSDVIAGGTGTDRLIETGDVNFTLSNTILTGLGTTTLSGLEQASLTGGLGDNSFDLRGWSGPATIDGGPGTDALSVSGTSGDDTPSVTTSQITFGAVTTNFANVEHLAVFGGDGNDVFNIPDLGAAQGSQPAFVSALTDLTLSGGAGNDTFNLVSQDNITITVDGGGQPAGGADTLNFNENRLIVTQQPGELQPEGKQPVFYLGIEILNQINQAYQLFLSLIQR